MPYNMNHVIEVGRGADDHDHDHQFPNKKNPSPPPPNSSSSRAGNSVAGRFQYQYQFIPPSPPTLPSIPPSTYYSTPFLVDRSRFEQEKVSVRLVENHGLVVEPDDDDNENEPFYYSSSGRKNCSCKKDEGISGHNPTTTEEYDTTLASASASYFCNANGSSTGPIHAGPRPPTRRISPSRIANGKCLDCCRLSDEGYIERTRHGSTSVSGHSSSVGLISAVTPLMNVKEDYKVPVIVNSAAIKRKGENNIHLCCALVFGFSASLFFSLTLLLAKVLKNRDHHPISIAFWRYLGILVPSVPLGLFYFVRGKKNKVLASVWPIQDMDKAANALALLMRGVLGSTSVILRFCSLKYLPIGDSSVISYCAPVFAAIFAPFCLKDKGGFLPVMLGFVAVGGVVLISKPPFGSVNEYDSNTLKGVFLATLSMLCASGVLIIMRNLQKVHFSLMMFVLGIWGVFEAGVLAISLDVLKVPELLPDIVMMCGVATLTFFGQLFVLLAIRMGQVGSVSVMRSCDIFLSFLWQYLFLKTEPEALGILSAILIVLAVWLISFRQWMTTLRTDNEIRKRLWCILY
ncbi:Solute carrier family 35 member G1 [Orchesella cincta]|uniref:Solute carrier family 35 member G1 n=1 Tax=Orchesella cincta TaxID=48709 RepID=A0A1D2N3Q3_ORCCI|nr:Solute carrier family 35 member G1 [Orchesella cincta]